MADELFLFYNLTKATITIYCNGELALYMSILSNKRIKLSHPNYDLLMAIRYALSRSKITWYAEHVRGNQDDKQPYEELTREEQLNCKMDKTAKQALLHLQPNLAAHSTGAPWQL